MKPVLHFQIPMLEGATKENQVAIDIQALGKFMKIMDDKIGKDYDIVASPMKLQTCDNVDVKNIEMTMKDVEKILNIKG